MSRTAWSSPWIRYAYTGFSRSGAEELSITVGAISRKPTFFSTARSGPAVSYGFEVTCAGSRFWGTCTGGAGRIEPVKVWPTTTTSIAPLPSGATGAVTRFTSAGANSFATDCAADCERLTRGFQQTAVWKYLKL